MYGSETWSLTVPKEKKFERFERKILRVTVSWKWGRELDGDLEKKCQGGNILENKTVNCA